MAFTFSELYHILSSDVAGAEVRNMVPRSVNLRARRLTEDTVVHIEERAINSHIRE